MRVVIDRERCQGAGMCVLTAPAVFDQSEEDGRVVVLDPEPAPALEAAVARAAQLCPNGVISLLGGSAASSAGAPTG
ncbi:ferredoxin [Oryzihumus leptocrescens]|uniref:Ferredoxin n=1 Tax=Oryzihumus leptocrescens TaxID=297536 RepID=A0A542ZFA9_9MICO|nr:ferredoxin [Oryzihumus leptocrescens]TQL59014.1 ferredoxin [Oryzihumus leptocrescens]